MITRHVPSFDTILMTLGLVTIVDVTFVQVRLGGNPLLQLDRFE
jgi:hypothetical protein